MRQGSIVVLISLMAVACCAFASQVFAQAQVDPQPAPTIDALESGPVGGHSLGEWTAQWWRWVYNQPVEPYLDPDGRLCELGQDGPVWFLAGTDGTFRPKRHCGVPEGKYLLVPVINMIYIRPSSVVALSCEDLQVGAAVNNDALRSAVAMLDGKPLGEMQLRRVRSGGCFRLDAHDPNSQLAAADGYWLMIKPLTRGRHTLVIGANYDAPGEAHGDMNQNFEYVLDVGGTTLIGDVDRFQKQGTASTFPDARQAGLAAPWRKKGDGGG